MIASANEPADDPGAALFAFLTRMADEAEVKRHMSDAITVPSEMRKNLHAALGELLHRAQEAGAVRAGRHGHGPRGVHEGDAAEHARGRESRLLLEIVLSGLQSSRKP